MFKKITATKHTCENPGSGKRRVRERLLPILRRFLTLNGVRRFREDLFEKSLTNLIAHIRQKSARSLSVFIAFNQPLRIPRCVE